MQSDWKFFITQGMKSVTFYQLTFWLQMKVRNVIGGFALNSWFYDPSSHKLSSNFSPCLVYLMFSGIYSRTYPIVSFFVKNYTVFKFE